MREDATEFAHRDGTRSHNNAANPLHLERKLLGESEVLRYKVAWIGGANVLYDRAKLLDVGGYSFWRLLPAEHAGEEVEEQRRDRRDGQQPHSHDFVLDGTRHHAKLRGIPTELTRELVDALQQHHTVLLCLLHKVQQRFQLATASTTAAPTMRRGSIAKN